MTIRQLPSLAKIQWLMVSVINLEGSLRKIELKDEQA